MILASEDPFHGAPCRRLHTREAVINDGLSYTIDSVKRRCREAFRGFCALHNRL